MAENKHSSIDDVVNHAPTPAASNNNVHVDKNHETIDHKMENKKEGNGWSFKQIAKDVLKFSPIAAFNWYVSGGAAYLAGTASFLAASSTLFAPIGYSIARYIINRKKKKETTWWDIRKDLATGNFVGAFAYWLYQIPEYLVKTFGVNTSTFAGKVLKTSFFNPGMYFPFIAAYMPAVYIRDNIGVKKALKGLFNGKIFGYIKEAYQKDMKKNYWPTLTKSSLILFGSHLATIGYNLVTMPSLRVLIGAGHDVVFATIAGSQNNKAVEEHMYEKSHPAEAVKPAYHPNNAKSKKTFVKKIDNFLRLPGENASHNGAYAGAH
ncbi:MAG: hypothetical protein QS98_C0008G0009 [archaeon GW2011_AR3]|nr:MAG: hypothetical protein QS98_C0008G0009 [archaeon GW2011_AR3]